MEIAFGLFVLAILIIGLINRKKSKRQWREEERRDDSGAWIDKRAGERGTWGSLDEEMDSARRHVARESRVTALTDVVRSHAFEQYPGFHALSDAQIKTYSAFVRTEVAGIIRALEQMKDGVEPAPQPFAASYDPVLVAPLQKRILDFAYLHYPDLLDLDIDSIRQLDGRAGTWAAQLLGEIEVMKRERN